MKKLMVLVVLFAASIAVNAQHQINSFFDQLGAIRLETQELHDDTIVTVFHRTEDVVWSRVVYRIIDMRYKQNFPLYFPAQSDDPSHRSLFRVLLDAIADGLPVYEKSMEQGDIKPDFKLEPMGREQVPMILNTDRNGELGDGDIATSEYMLLNYDSVADKMTFNNYAYKGFIRNQTKWLIQEVVFFDKHTSRLHRQIMGIAPMQADNVDYYEDMPVMDALYGQVLFWVPFQTFRPYLTKQYTISSMNEQRRVTFDEFFTKHLYTSYLVGEANMYNRMIPDYAKTEEDVKKEQQRIETEMLTFEQDLWEY